MFWRGLRLLARGLLYERRPCIALGVSSMNTTTTDREKTIDLPPRGARNADPLTNAPGAHPIETGVGAAVAGAASGLAVGAVAGPVGAVIGAALGAVAGGYAGKGIGELIDPTTEDNWLRDHVDTSRAATGNADNAAWDYDSSRPAHHFGVAMGQRFTGRRFDAVEAQIRDEWQANGPSTDRTWDESRSTIRAGFERVQTECCGK